MPIIFNLLMMNIMGLGFIEQKELEILARRDSGDSKKSDTRLLEQLNAAKNEISLFLEYLVLFSDVSIRKSHMM